MAELFERLKQFGLSMHPEKTRLLEFGRRAAIRRKRPSVWTGMCSIALRVSGYPRLVLFTLGPACASLLLSQARAVCGNPACTDRYGVPCKGYPYRALRNISLVFICINVLTLARGLSIGLLDSAFFYHAYAGAISIALNLVPIILLVFPRVGKNDGCDQNPVLSMELLSEGNFV